MLCEICKHDVAKTVEMLLEHISRVHAHSSNFQMSCIVAGCQRTYRNYAPLRRHLREVHKYYSRQPNNIDQAPLMPEEDYQFSNDNSTEEVYNVEPPTKKHRAEWILKVRETNNITQVCTENISDVTNLCSSIIHDLTADINEKLLSHNATPELHQDIMKVLETPNFSKPFDGLETHYKQMQYFRECFNFVVRFRLTWISYVCTW